MARNWEMESINSSELTVSRSVVGRVIETGEPLITTNAQEDQRFAGQESIVAFNLRSILCVPLKVKNDLIGVIYADNRIRAGIFADSERNLLVAFANQAAVAIENARLFSSRKNTLEEVTGLKNLMDNIFASIASGVITADIQNQIHSETLIHQGYSGIEREVRVDAVDGCAGGLVAAGWSPEATAVAGRDALLAALARVPGTTSAARDKTTGQGR